VPPPKIKPTHRLTMTDVLYILSTFAFFGLMIAFIWACGKV
jgi:hypothetical protein